MFKDSVEWWRWWRRWGNHCYKAERRARDTTYTLKPRDEGGDGGVIDVECLAFLLDEKMPLGVGFEERNDIELLKLREKPKSRPHFFFLPFYISIF